MLTKKLKQINEEINLLRIVCAFVVKMDFLTSLKNVKGKQGKSA